MKMNRPFDMGAGDRRSQHEVRVDSAVTGGGKAATQAPAFSWAMSDSLLAMGTGMADAPAAPIHVLGFELLK